MIVQGAVAWKRDKLELLIAAGQFEIATDDIKPLMGQLWTLTTLAEHESKTEAPELTDGTGLWWLSWQRAGGGMQALPRDSRA